MAFDWRCDLDRVLHDGRYDALVHTAGPFQGQDYGSAEVCIRHRVHYFDLADDAAFVGGIDRLDAQARAADVLICAGASTAPALTAAVLDEALKTGPVDRVAFCHPARQRHPTRDGFDEGRPVAGGAADSRPTRPPCVGKPTPAERARPGSAVGCGMRSAGAGAVR